MFELQSIKPVDKEFLKTCHRDKNGHFNPFLFDLYNMGRRFDKDTFFMTSSNDTEEYTSGYFINVKTGERQKLVKLKGINKTKKLDNGKMCRTI